MIKTPKGLRTQIGIFGRRNVGKSTFLNAITRQNAAVVSNVPGTTTDPVEKPMEMLPLGPVLFIDTAGIDDDGALGGKRIEKTKRVFERADVAIIIAAEGEWGGFEEKLIQEFKKRNTPLIVVFNKTDIAPPAPETIERLDADNIPHAALSALSGEGMEGFKNKLLEALPDEFFTPNTILGDLVPPGGFVVLVVPIDLEAPKGRLIMPQVQSIRDALDNDAYCVVVKERELAAALDNMKKPPALVVTDSQAFLKVAADVPDEIPMTSFSILFARFKGDLTAFAEGAERIDDLKPGDRILVAEACSHHPVAEDIGRVKIPRWLEQYVGGKLEFTHHQGHDFPENPGEFDLVIHCGSCVFNPKNLMARVAACAEAGVPITNYGVAIARVLGIFDRAMEPFSPSRIR
jgi:[FeFe] hydrogenase H-cluster maturation GTPase HydF